MKPRLGSGQVRGAEAGQEGLFFPKETSVSWVAESGLTKKTNTSLIYIVNTSLQSKYSNNIFYI